MTRNKSRSGLLGPGFRALAAVALALGVTTAQAGPLSKLYLTYTESTGYAGVAMVQGNTISSFPLAYGQYEIPIAVDGDVRTTGYRVVDPAGGQYSLSGTPSGVTYMNPGFDAYDSTTDGGYNYVVDYTNGDVLRTDRDYQNPTTLFNVGDGHLGITYDPSNNSLWISGWYANQAVTNYSMTGSVLSSFDTGHSYIGALALDHADNTLWIVNDINYSLVQYSKGGSLLSSGPNVGYTLGGEFDLGSANGVPEPSALLLVSSALLLLAQRRRSTGSALRAC